MSRLDSRARKLLKAHKRQLVRKGAVPLNFESMDSGCFSLTDLGILETRLNPHGRSYIHIWAMSRQEMEEMWLWSKMALTSPAP